MPATLDLPTIRLLADSFPNTGWQTIRSSVFVADRNGRLWSDWRSTKDLEGFGGVYAILLPDGRTKLILKDPATGDFTDRVVAAAG